MAQVNFTVEFPVANPLKFTLDGSVKDQRANVDQQSFEDAVHASTQKDWFGLPFEKTDPLQFQFYNNFPIARVQIISKYNGKTQVIGPTQTASVAVVYRGKKYRSACQFASINGKLFIYFQEGPEYTDEDFLVQGDVVNHEGRLPAIEADADDDIRYRIGDTGDFQFTEIESIEWNPTLQAHGYLTDVDYTILEPVSGVVE